MKSASQFVAFAVLAIVNLFWPAIAKAYPGYMKIGSIAGDTQVGIGEQVDVLVGSTEDMGALGALGGYEFHVRFDPLVIDLTGTGDLILGGGSSTLTPTLGGMRILVAGGPGGTAGDFMQLSFQTLALGSSLIELTELIMYTHPLSGQQFPSQPIDPSTGRITVVPEPTALALALAGMAGLVVCRTRWRRR